MREREAKLLPPAAFRLPDLADVAPGVAVETGPDLVLRSDYWDTDDLRLIRWGASLRHRTGEGWTVKLPVDASGPYLVRAEQRFAGRPDHPPADAVDLVRACVRHAPLVAVAHLQTLRRSLDLVGPAGAPLAEVVDDEVTVLDGREPTARFREIEVEQVDDGRDGDGAAETVVAAVVARLSAAGADPTEPLPKVVRVLGRRASAPPDVVVDDPCRATTGAEVVRIALARSARDLVLADPGVRLGDDPEVVHRARVATRRLRSDLRTFRPLLDRAWADSRRAELAGLGRLLGAVRDDDVLLAYLRTRALELPAADRPGAGRLLEQLVERREADRARLLAAMRDDRYLDLLDHLVDAARSPHCTPTARRPPDRTVPRLVRRPWKRLRRAIRALDAEPPDAALHEVRILAKRCRYAAEAAAPVVGKPARRLARRLAKVQDVLGAHHDAVVAGAWLRSVAVEASPAEAFAAGRLSALVDVDARASRATWRATWERAADERLSDWL